MNKPILLLIVLLTTLQVSTAQSRDNKHPNIVFIYIDDMGYGDLSCFGNSEIQTPNIDRIAKQGLKFTNFYVASPICSPSRAAAITGQYPSRNRIYSYLDSREKNRQRDMADYLDPSLPTIAKALKGAGYATAHFGKWHLGGGRDVGDAPLPQAYGIDESLTSFEGLGDRLLDNNDELSIASATLGRGKITWVEKWQKTGIFVDRTLDFIQQHKTTPFYVELWPDDVHDPYKPNPEWLKKFSRFANNHYKQDFYAVLDNLDKQVGRLLDKLEEWKLLDNTLIIFASDNGPTDWPFYYKEGYWPPASADPFRGRKWSLYEGGVRTPLIVQWKGHIPAGKVNDTTIINAIDFLPSICTIVNLETGDSALDGEDVSAALLGRQQQRKQPLFWEYGRNEYYLKPGNPRFVSPNLATRKGDWKLLVNDDGSHLELYNLKTDFAETTNVANQFPEVADQLKQLVLTWRKTLP